MTNQFNIADKVCILTGGTGVLGGALSEYLLAQGMKVVILGSNLGRIQAKLDELKAYNDQLLGLECDVLDKSRLEMVRDEVLQKFGRIDVLINAAGGNMPGATIADDQNLFDLKIDEFEKVTALNLNGTLYPSMVFGEVMANQGQGIILNYSSMAAYRSLTRVIGYSAAKAAVSNLTGWMATEFALKYNGAIRVNAIAPGFFITHQNERLLTNEDGSYTERGQKVINNTPMSRFGKPDELNGVVHWLISDASTFVTGVIVPVDGGFNAFSGV